MATGGHTSSVTDKAWTKIILFYFSSAIFTFIVAVLLHLLQGGATASGQRQRQVGNGHAGGWTVVASGATGDGNESVESTSKAEVTGQSSWSQEETRAQLPRYLVLGWSTVA